MTLQKSVVVVGKDNGGSSSGGRRPPGRPQGAKNKPKAPIVVIKESPNAYKAHILEIQDGTDVLRCLSNYSRNLGRGLSIMSCSGTVARVTFRQPTGSAVTLQGEFQILTMSGTFLPHPTRPYLGDLVLYVAGEQGEVIGGSVMSPLVASSLVVVSVGSFANAMIERLPLEESDSSVAP